MAVYGPFNFPENTQPISPIVWLCFLEEDFVLNQPLHVTLPHFLTRLTDEKLQQYEIGFIKASHNDCTISTYGQMMYTFKPCNENTCLASNGNKGYGVLHVKHCCFYCIKAKKTQKLAIDAGYCLVQIESSISPKRSEVSFAAIYFLGTCLKV